MIYLSSIKDLDVLKKSENTDFAKINPKEKLNIENWIQDKLNNQK